jgi:hypothetical protein
MIRLTPFEHVLRNALVDSVRAADSADPQGPCLSYRQLGQMTDPDGTSHYPMTRPPFRGLNEALGHISMYEVEHGRPMLSAIVVNEETGYPGNGFARLGSHLGFNVEDDKAFWRSELAALVRLWTAADMTLLIDSALEVVMGELATIKQLVRRSPASRR